jgi:hypothetical protein
MVKCRITWFSNPSGDAHGMRNEMDLSNEMGSRPSFVAFVFSV